jgi:cytochrome c-type biogenesis protein CcmH/NrfG
MSLLFLASNLLDRVRLRQRTAAPAPQAPAEPPISETPRQLRDRLREEIRNRGGKPEQIEKIAGNCDQQVATQIANYTEWLTSH